MAPRIRSIKPTRWDSESLGRCTVLARLTFVGMISLADDSGRGRAGVRYLLGRIHTYAGDVAEDALVSALAELRREGCAVFYEVDAIDYYFLPGWKANQLINRPSPSVLPPPPGHEPRTPEASNEEAPPLPSESPLTPGGVEVPVLKFPVQEGTGPGDWPLWSAKIVEYRLSFPGVDIEAECRKARQWCVDNVAGRKPYNGMASFLSRWLSTEHRKLQEGKEAGKTAMAAAKAAKRCQRCHTAAPMNDTWPYCSGCTWCSKNCGKEFPAHKSFRVVGGEVVCTPCVESTKEAS